MHLMNHIKLAAAMQYIKLNNPCCMQHNEIFYYFIFARACKRGEKR
jgi:hypothetical protein